MHSSLQTFQG
ncbi:hypothetical protein ECEC1865_1765, partial [Escherichia coli EC1865]